MSHVRQQIRDRIAATCTGLTTTGASVFVSQTYALKSASLPCLVIWSESENVADYTIGGWGNRTQRREVDVMVQAEAAATSQVDDTLDTICAEVEAALAADAGLNGTAQSIELLDTDISLFRPGADADQHVGYARMLFRVTYSTAETDPETAI